MPEFYLREWRIPKTEQVYVYDKESKKTWSTNIANIVSVNYFYDFDLKDFFSEDIIQKLNDSGQAIEGRLKFIEKMFSDRLEGPFSGIFAEIINKANQATPWEIRECFFISPEIKEAISVYLAYQYLRVKTVRTFLTDSSDRLTQHMERMGITDEQIQKYTLSKESARRIHNRMLLDKEQIYRTARGFSSLTWILGINKTNSQFFTSDNPISMINHNREKLPLLGTGLLSRGVEVFFPVSPDTILIMVDSDYPALQHLKHDERRYIELNTTSTIERYNFITAMQAEQFVISCNGDFSILEKQ